MTGLLAAIMLLTRLPLGPLGHNLPSEAFRRGVWAYPLVGAAVGALGGAVMAAGRGLELPPLFVGATALAVMAVVTGGLHEDGLADAADSLGGTTPARRLEIMRDSRLGSFGALALMLSVIARVAALAALAGPVAVWWALPAAAALGRAAMLLPFLLLPPSRPDGLASGIAGASRLVGLVGLALGVGLASLFLPSWSAARATALAGAVGLGMAVLARRHVGGHTGDILGATSVLAECTVLGSLCISMPGR